MGISFNSCNFVAWIQHIKWALWSYRKVHQQYWKLTKQNYRYMFLGVFLNTYLYWHFSISKKGVQNLQLPSKLFADFLGVLAKKVYSSFDFHKSTNSAFLLFTGVFSLFLLNNEALMSRSGLEVQRSVNFPPLPCGLLDWCGPVSKAFAKKSLKQIQKR